MANEPTITDKSAAKPPPRDYLSAHTTGEGHRIVRLMVFGKGLTVGPFASQGEAVQCATEWNDHFSSEWAKVRNTNAVLMKAFGAKLRAEGVCDGALRNALDAVATDLLEATTPEDGK